jgi:ABC-type Mn2+/Zn2+ transport system permease subunit
MIIEALVLPASVAAAAALIGCFAVMRRMALAADALSHVALPGVGIALALQLNPLFGAAVLLFFGALLVWALEDTSRLSTETIVGVLFSAALAVGSLLASGEDLLDALLGHPGALSPGELWFGLLGSAAVVGVVLSQRHRLVVALVSPDLARTSGVNVRRLELMYLQMFALATALGLRYLGVLLMGSLIIIPAATAKRWSRTLSQMLASAVVLAVGVTVAGAGAAAWLHRESGPVIVTLAAAVFLVTLLRRPA